MKKLILSSLFSATLFGAFHSTAEACNACIGRPDNNLAPALSGAIFGLAIPLALVCFMFIGFIVFLAKRDGLPVPQEPSQG